MVPEQVFIMKQDVIPALANQDGELAVAPDGHLIKKPHGHGDVHFCLYRVTVVLSCDLGRDRAPVAAGVRRALAVLLPGHQRASLLHDALHGCDLRSTTSSHGQCDGAATSSRGGGDGLSGRYVVGCTVLSHRRRRRAARLQRRVQPAGGGAAHDRPSRRRGGRVRFLSVSLTVT